jgi:hypothetical protein
LDSSDDPTLQAQTVNFLANERNDHLVNNNGKWKIAKLLKKEIITHGFPIIAIY